MAVNPTYPGVYIQELPSAVHPITGVATSIGAFVGYTARGIDNRAEQIFNFSDYERLFGGLASDSELSYAVQQFFANGGTQAYVVRVPRTGAKGAQVAFGGLTFTALSSGTWADGHLLIDVDYTGVDQTTDPTAFNLTVTNLVDGTVESFPNVSLKNSQSNYIMNVVNDSDNGSQLVNVQVAGSPGVAPAMTGVVGKALVIANVNSAFAGTTAVAGNVALTNNSATVTGTGTHFTTDVHVGQLLVFASDTTDTLYQVASIANDTSLTLTARFAGATAASTTATVSNTTVNNASGYGVQMSVSSPATPPSPFPITITAFPNASPLPQTVAGLAAQLQRAVNSALAVQMPGASVQCTVSGTGNNQAIRVNALLPQVPDAVVSFTAPSSGPADASAALGIESPPATSNVAHYALGTGNGNSGNTPLPGTVALTNGSTAVTGTGTNFTTSLKPGEWVVFAADTTQTPFQVSSISSDTSLTLAADYGGTTVASSSIALSSWGGEQTSSTAGLAGSGLPGTADLIGDQALFTGIYALAKVDLFNLVCIPDATRASAGNPSAMDSTVDPNSIYSAAIALCDARRAFLLLDCPPFVDSVSAAVDWKPSGLTVVDENGAAFFPRLRVPDPLNNFQLRTFAPCGVVAGLYARIDAARGVWKAPAGTEATLSGVQGLVYKLSDGENGVLNPLGLNCFRTFPVYGTVLWGARTLVGADAETSQWKYVPVRRVALFLEESLYRGTQWVVFEPNDEPLWSAIRLNVGSFMQNLFKQGYFQGKTPSEAYFVKCDSETTTQTDVDNGIVNIIVGFAPLKPAEFVIIQIQQLAGQSAS